MQSQPPRFEETLSLIERLYAAGTPTDEIARIDKNLKEIQSSPAGWDIADRLLESPHAENRFFGALTFTVKLNNGDWRALSDEDKQSLEQRLIKWGIQLVLTGD